METLSVLLALCEEKPLMAGGFPIYRASNTYFDVFFDVILNKLLNKPSISRRLKTPWRPYDVTVIYALVKVSAVHEVDNRENVILTASDWQ